MTEAQPVVTPGVVRNISDTARWAAYFRAQETARPDAIFRDPFAERLAGQHGVDIANTLPEGNKHAWAWVARTYLFDQFIAQELQQGVDMVVNLAAGLDARPYRMKLPASLQWIEVDLPEILAYKEEILANEKPTCALERIRLDLSDSNARRALFANLNQRAKKISCGNRRLVDLSERRRSRCPRQRLGIRRQFSTMDYGFGLAGPPENDAKNNWQTSQRSWRAV